MAYVSGEAALLFVEGQSNAEGTTAELVSDFSALPNVFMMPTAARDFINFEMSFFSGVGYRNNTYRGRSVAQAAPDVSFALLWQSLIDLGASLPDLYIVKTCLGGTGFSTRIETADRSKWHPFKYRNTALGEPSGLLFDDPEEGVINQDSSLFEHSRQVKIAAVDAILRESKTPRVIGVWLLLGEQDALSLNSANEWYQHLTHFKNMTDHALGGIDTPVYVAMLKQPGRPGSATISSRTEDFLLNNPESRGLYPQYLPSYVDQSPNYGIFVDGTHYSAQVHDEMADAFYAASVGVGRLGPIARRYAYT